MFLATLIAVALIAVVLIAVTLVLAALYLIHTFRWGPSVAHQLVDCPEKKVPALIQLERKQGSFGALLEPDVTSCSLMPAGRVDCDKKCLC